MKQKEDALQSLVLSLTKGELKVLRHHLTISGKKDNKYLKLLNFYLKQRAAKSVLSKSAQEKMLASRLKRKILDTLIFDVNLDRSEGYDDLDQASVIIRKKMAEYLLLTYSKPSLIIRKQILNEILIHAEKYGLYFLQIDILRLLLYDFGVIENLNYFNKINQRIEQKIKCWQLLRKTQNISTYVKFKLHSAGQREKKLLVRQIIKYTKNLESENQILKLPLVEYFITELHVIRSLLTENKKEAKKYSEKSRKIIMHNPSVYNKNRLASNLVQLNQLEILEGNFNKALGYAIEAKKNFISHTSNFYLVADLEFHTLFHLRKFREALLVSKQLLNSSVEISGAFFYSKYHYNHANILFIMKDYKGALKSLSANSALRDDKSGWDIGLRVLTILCHIEIGNYDQAMSATEALRKHINRSGRKIPVGERELIIFQMLNSLSLNSYDFQKTFVAQEKNLKLLKSNDPKVKYQYLEHELVKFDEWFEGKVKSE